MLKISNLSFFEKLKKILKGEILILGETYWKKDYYELNKVYRDNEGEFIGYIFTITKVEDKKDE